MFAFRIAASRRPRIISGLRLNPSVSRIGELLVAAFIVGLGFIPLAGETKQPNRVVLPVNSFNRTTLSGHIPPSLDGAQDQGKAPAKMQLKHLVLTLTRPSELEAAFKKLLNDQEDRISPSYQQWLTPEQVGDLYGPTHHDINAVSSWLVAQGLIVESISSSGMTITFSGTVESVDAAFGVEVRQFKRPDATAFYATLSEPSLPSAIAPVCLSVVGLSQQRWMTPYRVKADDTSRNYLFTSSSFASRYGLTSFSSLSINGSGQRVAVLASSRINDADIAAYQAISSLPKNLPIIIVPPGTSDPGITGGDAQAEATLDVERVAGTAPGASVDLVAGEDSSSTTLLRLIEYATETLNDPIMNLSFYACEANVGKATILSFDSMFATAAAQGIGTYVASGDSGAAGCEPHGAPASSSPILSPNALCASQYVTCVGGSEVTYSSGEAAWNEPGTTTFVVDASGGGASAYIGKPAWQVGPSVPTDAARDTPDVSLPAAAVDPYQACIFGSSSSCNETFVFGTSAAAPTFAGIAALWNQQSQQRLGTLNAHLYAAANSPLNVGYFHDIDLGSSGLNSCDLGTPSECNNSIPSSFNLTGGLKGYELATGYDQVTGLGTLDGYDLGQFLYGGTKIAPLTLTGNGDPVGPGGYADLTATFRDGTSPIPTGFITFYQPGVYIPGYDHPLVAPSTPEGAMPTITQSFDQVNPSDKTVTVIAHYSGDSNYAPAESTYVVPVTGSMFDSMTLTASATSTSSTTPITLVAHFNCGQCGTIPTGKAHFYAQQFDMANNVNATILLGTVESPDASLSWSLSTDIPSGTNRNVSPAYTTVYAVYVGDSNFKPVGTEGLNVASRVTTTTTTLATLPDSIAVNTPFQATCIVSVGSSGLRLPSGGVLFIAGQPDGENSVRIGPITLSPTSNPTLYSASADIVFPETGQQSVSCLYTGDAYYSFSSTYSYITATAPPPLKFLPVTPCRVVDTRGANGAFGAPELAAGATREFDVPQSGCGIPSTAVAYSLNVTVLPDTTLNYLTLWPSGTAQPNVSTLNSYDGRVKANGAIVPAGSNGGVNVFVSDGSQVILDVDGYFVPGGTASSLAFYPLTPCRVADTRGAAGALSGPFVAGQTSRSFPVQQSACNIPSTAQAYSLNVTAIPHTTLNYLTTWPTGQAQPNVSTLNAPTGAVTANAAIVPAGSNGDVSLFVSDDADLILDINGYFAPAATGGLSLYTTTPCRLLDTRGESGVFSGVLQAAVDTSTCALPSTAQAYVLNATVVPARPLNYLTLWPDGQSQPNVSTLNANDAAITSNLAVVPTNNGKIDAFASGLTQLILDISSYFAP